MTAQHDLFQASPDRSEIRQYPTLSQGAEANRKGKQLEDQVKDLFVSREAIVVPFIKYSRKTGDLFNERSLVRQFEYNSLYGAGYKRRVDFVYIHGQQGPRVAIECKVQDDTGSADEKLPGLYLESREWGFADHIWFVLSGEGFRKCYEHWLMNPGDLRGRKVVRVFTSVDQLRPAIRVLVERGDTTGGQRR